MKWEDAIHMWKQAMHESNPDASLEQWIAAAETRLNSEKQIREQLHNLFERCEKLLEGQKLLEAKAVLEDADRSCSGNYKIADLRKQLDSLRKRLDREIEKVLIESGYKQILSRQLEKTISLMQENLPELKKTLMIFQPSSNANEAQNSVEKTVFIEGIAADGRNPDVEDKRLQSPKTSRRKTKQT